MIKVREYLYEKFKDDSDPIKDLGIGIVSWDNLKSGDYIETRMRLFHSDITHKVNPAKQNNTYIEKNEMILISKVEKHGDNMAILDFKICMTSKREPWLYFNDYPYIMKISKKDFNNYFKPIQPRDLNAKVEKLQHRSY